MKKTVDEIKEQYPGLECIADGPYDYSVGYPEPGDLFNVLGTGDSPDDAWNDAWECLTNTGSYSKQKHNKVKCEISIDWNVDNTYYLYVHNGDKVVSAANISEESALRISHDTNLIIEKFPF